MILYKYYVLYNKLYVVCSYVCTNYGFKAVTYENLGLRFLRIERHICTYNYFRNRQIRFKEGSVRFYETH